MSRQPGANREFLYTLSKSHGTPGSASKHRTPQSANKAATPKSIFSNQTPKRTPRWATRRDEPTSFCYQIFFVMWLLFPQVSVLKNQLFVVKVGHCEVITFRSAQEAPYYGGQTAELERLPERLSGLSLNISEALAHFERLYWYLEHPDWYRWQSLYHVLLRHLVIYQAHSSNALQQGYIKQNASSFLSVFGFVWTSDVIFM